MKSEWIRTRTGRYIRRDGNLAAFVYLVDELWKSFVYLDGSLVDQGEWDGRSTAFRNAVAAMKRARELRAPLEQAAGFELEEDDD